MAEVHQQGNVFEATEVPEEGRLEALRTPEEPVGVGFQVHLGLASVAFWISVLPALQFFIPAQATAFGGSAATNVALVTTVGALCAAIGNPLWGALSDRTTSRFGRRRPWIVFGMLATVVTLSVMANAPGVAVLAVGWGLTQLLANAILAPLYAIIPDHIPARQRGLASALAGIALPVAIILGSLIVGRLFVQNVTLGYYAVIALIVLLVSSFVLRYREPRLPREAVEPFRPGRFLAAFWINPRRHPDFAFAWVARFFLIMGWAIGTGSFLFLYVQDVLRYEQLFPGSEAAAGTANLQLLSNILLIPSALLFGYISDRTGRRKAFVIGSSVLMGIGFAILGLFQTWAAAQVAVAFIGVGFGAYVAVDVALITQVLPSALGRGKDLGLINLASSLPQILAPVAGGLIVGALAANLGQAYLALFVIAAIAAGIGAALIQPIKGVR